jgi:hypothetical protein
MERSFRKLAKQQGLLVYFTGKPCKYGHFAERRTDSGLCCECARMRKRRLRAQKSGYRTRAEIDAARDAPRRQCTACKQVFPQTDGFFVLLKNEPKNWTGWSAECRECRNKRFREHYRDNHEYHIARVTAYIRENPIPKRNRDMIRYMRRKKRGCPPWANQRHLETIYAIADLLTSKTGIPHEVDHWYPLMHLNCCGLHVPWNLRVVPTVLNQAKGNRLPVDAGIVRDCTSLL